jgi:hypothetical protein
MKNINGRVIITSGALGHRCLIQPGVERGQIILSLRFSLLVRRSGSAAGSKKDENNVHQHAQIRSGAVMKDVASEV